MDAATLAKLERIAQAGIGILPLPGYPNHLLFARDGYAALVERRGEGLGEAGSPGKLDQRGLAPLIEQGGECWFVGKGFKDKALAGEVKACRDFFTALKTALL
jgi:hypothetical protein